jgi:hypothetical protein
MVRAAEDAQARDFARAAHVLPDPAMPLQASGTLGIHVRLHRFDSFSRR